MCRFEKTIHMLIHAILNEPYKIEGITWLVLECYEMKLMHQYWVPRFTAARFSCWDSYTKSFWIQGWHNVQHKQSTNSTKENFEQKNTEWGSLQSQKLTTLANYFCCQKKLNQCKKNVC